jgi:hypothetical protein
VSDHGPMTSQGAEVGIATGLPVDHGPSEEARHKANHRFQEAKIESINLSAEIQQGNPMLKAVFQQYQNRLMQLALSDPVCRSLEQIIRSWDHTMEVAPKEAERAVLRVMGPKMAPFVFSDEAAPE